MERGYFAKRLGVLATCMQELENVGFSCSGDRKTNLYFLSECLFETSAETLVREHVEDDDDEYGAA